MRGKVWKERRGGEGRGVDGEEVGVGLEGWERRREERRGGWIEERRGGWTVEEGRMMLKTCVCGKICRRDGGRD